MKITGKTHDTKHICYLIWFKYEYHEHAIVFLIQSSKKKIINLSFCTWAYYKQTRLKRGPENTRVIHVHIEMKLHEFTRHR